jgi:hypothetical protein
VLGSCFRKAFCLRLSLTEAKCVEGVFLEKDELHPFELKIFVQQLADFLVFLFEVKGLAPSTVKGYRSAISRTIHISGGEDFGNNQFNQSLGAALVYK